MRSGLLDRVAGAPITWGVDGSPGWGHLMDPDRVLSEMVEIGLRATELGPDGYLGVDPAEVLARLGRHGLELVGGFVPVIRYRDEIIADQLAYFERAANTLRAGGAEVAVLGPDSDLPGYDQQVVLGDEEWDRFFTHLLQLEAVATGCGVTAALHPHWGMPVQTGPDLELVLERSGVGLCIDTGHLALADIDIADVIRRAGERVQHVHLKDLDVDFAERVRSGRIGFRQAVIDGLFRPLGSGGVDIATVVVELERQGFTGWYVLEQDRSLAEDPAPGSGPIEDARQSMDFLRELATAAGVAREGAAPRGVAEWKEGRGGRV